MRPQFQNHLTSENWILSECRKSKLKPGSVTKAYRMPWRLFAIEIGQDLPQLFASGNRSMNVTEHNEAGATEEQQLQLAGHNGP